MFYQFVLISLFTFINIMHGKTNSFTFEGTYSVTISGEQRRLSVCENKDGVFWGLTKLLSDDIPAFNYVYALGRDPNGIQKRNIKGKEYNIYEAEGDSIWFKENELGTNTIQYYLKYNENKKYLKYTLSTAEFKGDSESINNVYALEKVSADVLGECFLPGEIAFDRMDYPLTVIAEPPNPDFGDDIIELHTDINNLCWGFYNKTLDSITEGAPAISTQFEWENKISIFQGTFNECCPRTTFILVSEFYYDNSEYLNSYLMTLKCEGSNFGVMLRLFETDRDFGECPLFKS